jgi:lipopolysaccharide biosynthesis protein
MLNESLMSTQLALPACSIFFHNYYGNDQGWMEYLFEQFAVPQALYYNGVSLSYNRLMQKESEVSIQEYAPTQNIIKRSSPNKGKDIGGKLVLMDAYLKLGMKSDYILLLHDKTSPYHSHSHQWQKNLFRIATKECREEILKVFGTDKSVGIVASQSAIRNEADNDQRRNAYTNSELIMSLRNKYNIHPPHLNYVAGTMFWVRAPLFERFFSEHAPLEIRRTLEEGNVTDETPTVTHAWERLLCWMVTSQGYKIKGF